MKLLLTKQQRYVLEVLDKLGSLRMEQLTALIRAKFCGEKPEVAPRLTEAMLRQLRFGNADLRVDGEIISRPNARSDPLVHEAVSIMLELSGGAPLDFSARQTPPVLLRFSTAGSRIALFAVLPADAFQSPPGRQPALSPTERVILLGQGGDAPAALPIANKCFLAVLQENGAHRFFEVTANRLKEE